MHHLFYAKFFVTTLFLFLFVGTTIGGETRNPVQRLQRDGIRAMHTSALDKMEIKTFVERTADAVPPKHRKDWLLMRGLLPAYEQSIEDRMAVIIRSRLPLKQTYETVVVQGGHYEFKG